MITAMTEWEERLAGEDGPAVLEAALQTLQTLLARCQAPSLPQARTAAELLRLKTLRAACDAALRTLAADSLQPPIRP